MNPWIKLARLEDIPERKIWPIEWADRPWILIREGLELRCFYDRCSHQDVKLSEFGQIDSEGALVCLAHGARFCLDSGAPLCFPASLALWQAEVKIEEGWVYIQLPGKLPDEG